ncbi:MAG: TraB/GumN family protein [candidate division Zixibacteria bacterium]
MKMMIASLVLSLLIAVPALCETSVWIAKTDSSVMYIGGTIHILRESDRPFPPEFDRAYNASEILVFETDIAQLQSIETQQAVMAKAMYTDGRTLDKVLSPEVYKKLDECCTENGLPLASMNQLKPSLIIITLLGMELKKLGADQEGIDAFYHGKATADKKSIKGLETIEEQVKMMTSLGDGNENAFILYSIDDMEKIEEKFTKMLTAWKAGDEVTLYDLFIKEIKQLFPKIFKSIIVDRNMDWMPKIEEYLNTSKTEFVLVGTAHLLGEEGVIAQLKKLGYKVEKFK